MKKLLSLCLVLLCLSASALAAEEDQGGPLRWMFGTDAEYTATPPDALAPVYSIAGLRLASDPSVLSGLKALISSIFGEYTPITTTAVITETVGENVNQYLVETVAPGAAGVDYEWLAGVFLFGILLFCLMKLLGGVLK